MYLLFKLFYLQSRFKKVQSLESKKEYINLFFCDTLIVKLYCRRTVLLCASVKNMLLKHSSRDVIRY